MLQIKSTKTRNLDSICQEHFDGISPYIVDRLMGLHQRQATFISKNLKKIVTGKPKELYSINIAYIKFCKQSGKNRLNDPNQNLDQVFNYDWFTTKKVNMYNGYTLAERLRVNTCPYCNRNYTVTVTNRNEKIVRPDFDHFFSQEYFPLLSLSFYNLIPSCQICNRSTKHSAKTAYGKYIHPYEEGFGDHCRFTYNPIDTNSSLGLDTKLLISLTNKPGDIDKTRRCERNVNLFNIQDIYQESHKGEIADIIRKHHVSGGKYLEVLHNSFPQLGSLEELYRMAFGAYYSIDAFEKRPLSKLTKDIVDQMPFVLPKLPMK